MDHKDHQVDRLARSLVSRRATLAGIAGLGLTLLGGHAAAAHNPAPGCRQIKDAKRRRACLKRARAHTRRHQQDRPSPRKPDAFCEGPTNETIDVLPGMRFVQTFTEPNGGTLTAVKLVLYHEAGGRGDYLLQINTVDLTRGIPLGLPTNNTIASTVIPRALVATAADYVLATFPEPPTLVAGRQYAIVLSLPSGTGRFFVDYQDPGHCPGGRAFIAGAPPSALFNSLNERGPADTYYATFVSP